MNSVLVQGILQVIINGAMLVVVGAWIRAKDQKIDHLQNKVDVQHEQRIKQIEDEQRHAKSSRGILYSNKVERADCDREMGKMKHAENEFRNAVLKLERVSADLCNAVDDIERVQVETASQAKALAAVQERIKDVKNG